MSRTKTFLVAGCQVAVFRVGDFRPRLVSHVAIDHPGGAEREEDLAGVVEHTGLGRCEDVGPESGRPAA